MLQGNAELLRQERLNQALVKKRLLEEHRARREERRAAIAAARNSKPKLTNEERVERSRQAAKAYWAKRKAEEAIAEKKAVKSLAPPPTPKPLPEDPWVKIRQRHYGKPPLLPSELRPLSVQELTRRRA